MKRINFNIKDRILLPFCLCLFLVCIFTLTIAYAALNAVLTINANTEVVASTWDIHLENVKVTSGSVSGNAPSIISPTTATFSTTLNMPGEFYEFTIDVVNNGSIDAMIDGITKTPTLTSTQAKYLNYIVEYENGESITTKQLVSKKSFVRLKVRVEFRKDIIAAELPSSSEVLNFSFTINYVQGDNIAASKERVNGVYKLVRLVSGNCDTIGSEICIDKECFYVISSDDNTITMLSKYNLYIGGKMVGVDEENSSILVEPLENPTGLQDSRGIGSTTDLPFFAVVKFASDEVHGENYCDYSGSLIETYVTDYKNTLESYDIVIESARLIKKEELINIFGCNETNKTCKDSLYPWIYSTSYWTETGSYDAHNTVWSVGSDGNFSSMLWSTNNWYAGVRPVIVISKDYF